MSRGDDPQAVQDQPGSRAVRASRVLHHGVIWDVVSDVVDLGPAGTVTREYLRHPGAVSIIALNDHDEVLLLHQYRHPVAATLWEPPAGLLDVAGEEPLAAAKRELAEEADLVAGRWWLLAEYLSSPGGSDEALHVFLARDLTPVAEPERHAREAEEADMDHIWLPLDDAVTAVLAGRVRNPSAVVGVLAAAAARARGWTDLRTP